MENNSVDVTRDMKKAERKAKWKARLNKAHEWWLDNRQYVIIAVPFVTGMIAKGIQVFGKTHNLRLEERTKDCRCYDTSLGHYWELKRKLSNDEWLYINARRESGDDLGSILEDLRVLK